MSKTVYKRLQQLTKAQHDFVKSKMQRLSWHRPESKAQEPKAVTAARKLVEKWDADQRKAEHAAREKLRNKLDDARRELLFGSPVKALAMVDKLNREYPEAEPSE